MRTQRAWLARLGCCGGTCMPASGLHLRPAASLPARSEVLMVVGGLEFPNEEQLFPQGTVQQTIWADVRSECRRAPAPAARFCYLLRLHTPAAAAPPRLLTPACPPCCSVPATPRGC